MQWDIPKIWQGGDVWILGGGSSLVQQFNIPNNIVEDVRSGKCSIAAYSPYLFELHKKHILAVNTSFLLGNWVDMLFFGDDTFYDLCSREITMYKGLKVSCHFKFDALKYKKKGIRYIKKSIKREGISIKKGEIAWNKNSGAAAINIAVHTGAKRIILVGFDMALDENQNQHWHSFYKQPKATEILFAKHLEGFGAIKEDADKLGVTIINTSMDSKIKQFEKINYKELL